MLPTTTFTRGIDRALHAQRLGDEQSRSLVSPSRERPPPPRRMALAADKAACVAKEGTPLVAGPESLPHRRKRVLGLLLAVLSALIASIDPLLTRFVRLNTDTDAAVIAWKYLAVGSILLAFVQVTSEDNPIGLIRKLHASKAYLHLGRAALLIALHNLLWTMAVLETSIGHAIAIAALAPLWSVLIEWRMFGDRVSMCTVFSVVLTSSAIALLFLNDPGGPIPGGQGMVVSASHTLRASDRPAPITQSGASGIASVQQQHVLTTVDPIAEPPELHGDEASRPPSLQGDFFALLSGFCIPAFPPRDARRHPRVPPHYFCNFRARNRHPEECASSDSGVFG